MIRGLQKGGQKIKPLIFADEMLISGVEWKKITFLAGCKVLSVKDFGEYFYKLGITLQSRETESYAKGCRKLDFRQRIEYSKEAIAMAGAFRTDDKWR